MRRLLISGLRYHRGIHALVIAGVAVAVAVLAGALVVGASVRASLRDLALARLGNTGAVVTSVTFFRQRLGLETGGAPVIVLSGALVQESSGRTAARVQIFGVDDSFFRLQRRADAAPSDRQAWISEALAVELAARPGDPLILRVAKPSDLPLSTIQGRREDAGERIRLTVARIAAADALGDFSLVPAQGAALTAIVPIARLQNDLDLEGRANTLLFATGAIDAGTASGRIRAQAQLEDYGLRVRLAPRSPVVVIESRAGIITPALTDALEAVVARLNAPAERVLVHLANAIRIGDREVPYSLVAGRGAVTGFALNEWAERDLLAKPGDRVTLDYYVWSDAAGLETRSADFTLDAAVPMNASGGDATFTPDYPGVTDADDLSSWDPPFPVDLKRVRKIDEGYWDEWRAAPKAFLPLQVAQQLWGTTHGQVSSLRVTVPAGETADSFAKRVSDAIARALDPATAGLQIRDARAEALAAAEGTTDFGEYFVYFSFFLVVSGLLLAAMFFALSVEQRARDIGLLTATGFTRRDITRIFVSEAAVLAGAGAVIGAAGAVAYAAVIMYGLRTWWRDAVGTSALTLHIDVPLIAIAVAVAFVAALLALAAALRTAFKQSPRALLGGSIRDTTAARLDARPRPTLTVLTFLAAVGILTASSLRLIPQVAGFFSAGALLMIGGLALFRWWLRGTSPDAHLHPRALVRFGAGYARWRPTRSVLSASLITFACFVIVSVGAFRVDPSGMSLDRALGTGGYVLMAEAIAPLMHNPNTAAGRQELGLDEDPLFDRTHVTRLRLRPGDEASCLTLYQPRNPRIVAPEASFINDRRFTFARSLAATPEERANPWLLLNRKFDDGAVAAIADSTSLTYAFHADIGDDYLFTGDTGTQTRLRIVGALADSVLQSEVVIGEENFVRLFPRREGYGMWMIDAPAADAPAVATLLEQRLSDFGVDVIDTRARLGAYHRVENTYLSTFQALGGLGLLIGTLGLAAVLARNVLERRRELGLLRAVGFTAAHLRTLVLSESLLLVGTGLALGTITALVAVLPSLLERRAPFSFATVALLVLAVAGTAIAASLAAARLATSASVAQALKSD